MEHLFIGAICAGDMRMHVCRRRPKAICFVTIVLAAMVVLPRPAMAAPPPGPTSVGANNKFHILTRALTARLAPPTQQNVAATARWRQASTAFLVYRQPTAGGHDRALIFTNAHVAGHKELFVGPGGRLTFPEGLQARTVRILSSSTTLDYALVEVELPAEAAAKPVTLRADGPRTGEHVYAVSGFTNIAITDPAKAVSLTRANRAMVQSALKGRKSAPTIQTGNIQHAETRSINVASGTSTVVGSTLPNRPGTSGSPVFSSEDHSVVALHAAGDPTSKSWQSFEVPMSLILKHVSNELRAGRIPPEARDLARGMLAGAAPPAKP